MPITVKYHTDDGESFDTLEAAKAHEATAENLIALTNELHKALSADGYGSGDCASIAKAIAANFTITRKPEQSL